MRLLEPATLGFQERKNHRFKSPEVVSRVMMLLQLVVTNQSQTFFVVVTTTAMVPKVLTAEKLELHMMAIEQTRSQWK